jgi:nitroreductase
MAMTETDLKIVHGGGRKLSKWPTVTWQHPEVKPENRPNPAQPQLMTAAQRSQHFHGDRRRPQVWPFIALAIMAMGALMVAAAMG